MKQLKIRHAARRLCVSVGMLLVVANAWAATWHVNGSSGVDVGCYEYQENAGTVDAGNVVPAEGWPSWVLGTWTGPFVNVVPEDDGPFVFKGSYELTLTSTGSHQKYVFDDGETGENDNYNRGWKTVESRDCHVIATCWCWDDEMDDKFDATYVFRDASCKCGDGKSSFKMLLRVSEGGDTVEGTLTKVDVTNPDVPELADSYGLFVPGERVEIEIPGLAGYAAKGLPSGLKLNKKTGEITGAARKPTGEAGVTVTFTKKDSPTLTAQFVVGPIPTINVALEGDAEKCKVTGANKAYLVGKKVSLQAKAPKGTAFVGWFRDGEPWPSEEECLEPKIKYVMEAENLDLVARFKAEEVSVTCDTSAGCVVKEQVSFPVAVDCESGLKSVSAKKLPSGLKYNKKTGCIEGAAKKAGTYPFSLTVTTKAGSKVTQSFALVVREAETPLAWWAGTYSGIAINWCDVCDEPPDCGPWELNMEMTISANGMVTGRLWDNGPDYGILKNGRKISENDETSIWTVELWWYEDGRCIAPNISTMTILSNGVLEYYDNDDVNPDDHCPIQATLTRKK